MRQAEWLTVIVAVGLVGVIELARWLVRETPVDVWEMLVVELAGAVLVGLILARLVAGKIQRIQDALALRRGELLALHDAGLAVVRELDLDAVLQLIIERARELVAARYGALSLVNPDGKLDLFLTSGVTAEERARIGEPPAGHGLLGVVLKEGQRLRIRDIATDQRSVGFPPDHPPMRSLLAVPIVSRHGVLGNLYMAEKQGAPEFTPDDEEILNRFAALAMVAIRNAVLHKQVGALAITEERERIAREIHDSLAQVLGYVNTKAQAAQELLDRGQPERASAQLAQLAEAARSAYADIREAILGLHTGIYQDQRLADALRRFVSEWEHQSGVAAQLTLPDDGQLEGALPPMAEVQVLRIVQEALANVRKHARASQARVVLRIEGGNLDVCVEDDGVGFDPESRSASPHPRFGLATMKERAETVGGTIQINSTAGVGTRVRARFVLTGDSDQSRVVSEWASAHGTPRPL